MKKFNKIIATVLIGITCCLAMAGCMSDSDKVERYAKECQDTILQTDLVAQCEAQGMTAKFYGSGTKLILALTSNTQLSAEEQATCQSAFILIFDYYKGTMQQMVDQMQEKECEEITALRLEYLNNDGTVIYSTELN